jgi:hypothetical protein
MTRIYKQFVKSCEECPNSYFINRIDGGGLACDAKDGWMMSDEQSTPEWCPLEKVTT